MLPYKLQFFEVFSPIRVLLPLTSQAAVGMLRLSTIPLHLWPRYLLLTVAPPLATVIGSSIYLDSRLYGAATLVPLNFLRFNVLEGKSRIFGEQALHWNFSQGLPAVLGAALPWAIWGFVRGTGGGSVGSVRGDNRALGWLVVWFLGEMRATPSFLVVVGLSTGYRLGRAAFGGISVLRLRKRA